MSSSISTLTSTYAAPLIGRLSNRQFGQAVVESSIISRTVKERKAPTTRRNQTLASES